MCVCHCVGIYTAEHDFDGGRTHSQPLFISESDSFRDIVKGWWVRVCVVPEVLGPFNLPVRFNLQSTCSCVFFWWPLLGKSKVSIVISAYWWYLVQMYGYVIIITHNVDPTILHTKNRLVHSFTCAEILPSQYFTLSTFAELGVVGASYIFQG